MDPGSSPHMSPIAKVHEMGSNPAVNMSLPTHLLRHTTKSSTFDWNCLMRHLPVWDGISKERSFHLSELLLASPGELAVFETFVGWLNNLAPCAAVTESSTLPSPSASTSLSPSAVPSASASPGTPPFPTSQLPSLPRRRKRPNSCRILSPCYIVL